MEYYNRNSNTNGYNGNGYYGNGNGSNGNGDKVNFNRLNFRYFVAQENGTIIGKAHDEDGNELTYAIFQDGTVRYKKNGGVLWKELSILDAASIRYFAGRFYNRSVPTYRTNQTVVK
jgi:hypothetical protein